MRIFPLTLLVLVAALVPAAGAAAAIGHPRAATSVVLRVTSGGGFVPQEANLRALPSFTLYGDGTVIVPGAVIQISPPPAISPLVTSRLSERKVQALLMRARQAGLLALGPIDYGDMGAIGISDAPTTSVLLNAGGRRVERRAYALGISPARGRLSARQVRARTALARFIAGLPRALPGALSPPHAIAIYVGAFRGQAQPGARRIVWPLKSDLATAGRSTSNGSGYRCITVAGSDVKKLLATLRRANQQSQWIARPRAQRTYQVIERPLLPDEPSCAAL